jgi:hypothetical protein
MGGGRASGVVRVHLVAPIILVPIGVGLRSGAPERVEAQQIAIGLRRGTLLACPFLMDGLSLLVKRISPPATVWCGGGEDGTGRLFAGRARPCPALPARPTRYRVHQIERPRRRRHLDGASILGLGRNWAFDTTR